MANRERDRELLIPVADSGDKDDGSSSSSSSYQSCHEVQIEFSEWINFITGQNGIEDYDLSKSWRMMCVLSKRAAPKSDDVYLKLLVKDKSFLKT